MVFKGDDSYVGHSGDSMCGSDLSLDGDSAGFDQMDDAHSLSGVDMQDVVVIQQQSQQGAPPSSQMPHPAILQQIQQHPMEVVASSSPLHQQQVHFPHPVSELIGQAALPSSGGIFHHHHHPINPIDKLYLMQNAYFRLDQ